MLIKRLIQSRNADAELPAEVRAEMVESLFAPVASLIAGAIGCSVIGAGVALQAANSNILLVSVALLAVGMLRVVSAFLYKRMRRDGRTTGVRIWEHVYESGAWVFAGLLGLLSWMTITQTRDASLHLVVSTTAAGYSAAISG